MKEAFRKYVLLRLYTDRVPANLQNADSAEANRRLLNDTFKTTQLPYYVILRVQNGKYEVVDSYSEGKINNVEGFIEFLQNNLPENANDD